MAGYIHAAKASFLSAIGVVSICDVHVSAYRGKPHHVLCVSSNVEFGANDPARFVKYILMAPNH